MEPEVNILPPTNRPAQEPAYIPTYEDRVGMALIALPVGGIFEIEKNVKEENRAKFVEVVKSYIDRSMGQDEGWDIDFNSNYTKIRKNKIWKQ